ncbi:hypothetical protein DL93DRAFT_2234606 [Clavulina sp. PMI_390]|nr:hypothetical protein DL93DRAFT_2234606 [Clavulina sp. PMI_390]
MSCQTIDRWYPSANQALARYLPGWGKKVWDQCFPLIQRKTSKQLASALEYLLRQAYQDEKRYIIEYLHSSPSSGIKALVVYFDSTESGIRDAWHLLLVVPLVVTDIADPSARSAAHKRAIKVHPQMLNLIFPLRVVSVIGADACIMEVNHPDMLLGQILAKATLFSTLSLSLANWLVMIVYDFSSEDTH